jgi:hypothetical protein
MNVAGEFGDRRRVLLPHRFAAEKPQARLPDYVILPIAVIYDDDLARFDRRDCAAGP